MPRPPVSSTSTPTTTGSSRMRTRPARPAGRVRRTVGRRPTSWPRRSSEGDAGRGRVPDRRPEHPSGGTLVLDTRYPRDGGGACATTRSCGSWWVAPAIYDTGYPGRVHRLTFPWSNEHPRLRTLSEQLYAPLRLPVDGVDVFSTLIAPAVRPAPAVVAHFKTMHAFTTPEAIALLFAGTARRATPIPPRSPTRSSSTPRACGPRWTST